MQNPKAFFLVWCPTGTKSPRFRHETYEDAVKEAERLAKDVPGQEFYVLCAETMRKVDNMTRVYFERNDVIPF